MTFAGRSHVVQSPTGSGKSAVLMCLPFLANAVSAIPAPQVAVVDEARRHPLVFLYCFPLETIRTEVLRVVDVLDGAVLATTPDGTCTVVDRSALVYYPCMRVLMSRYSWL